MSRYDCEYYAGYRAFGERHPNIPAVLASLHRKKAPMMRITDTTNESYARIKYLPDERIYEVMHLRHADPSGEVAAGLVQAGAALRHLEHAARKLLGEWQGSEWIAHDAETQAPRRVAIWEFYESECREAVTAASRHLQERDDLAMKHLSNMTRAIRRSVGKKTRILGPRRDRDLNDLATHRVAGAVCPDSLALALLPEFLT